ncbi:hypothetical protein SNEBB_008875 [Seison nebaliae]|nr:hypothetical protein SNEBB_008875 [Seison nebaliae]
MSKVLTQKKLNLFVQNIHAPIITHLELNNILFTNRHLSHVCWDNFTTLQTLTVKMFSVPVYHNLFLNHMPRLRVATLSTTSVSNGGLLMNDLSLAGNMQMKALHIRQLDHFIFKSNVFMRTNRMLRIFFYTSYLKLDVHHVHNIVVYSLDYDIIRSWECYRDSRYFQYHNIMIHCDGPNNRLTIAQIPSTGRIPDFFVEIFNTQRILRPSIQEVMALTPWNQIFLKNPDICNADLIHSKILLKKREFLPTNFQFYHSTLVLPNQDKVLDRKIFANYVYTKPITKLVEKDIIVEGPSHEQKKIAIIQEQIEDDSQSAVTSELIVTKPPKSPSKGLHKAGGIIFIIIGSMLLVALITLLSILISNHLKHRNNLD